ncbi:bola protein [Earliella scabrosa]|nr:bola protein [Earliella scabrosa]
MLSLALARRIARPSLVATPSTAFARWYAATQANFETEGEKVIYQKLTETFSPTELQVQDVSGGCGTFYNIIIASDAFKGLPLVKQQRLVNQTLKEEIQGIHGLQVRCEDLTTHPELNAPLLSSCS